MKEITLLVKIRGPFFLCGVLGDYLSCLYARAGCDCTLAWVYWPKPPFHGLSLSKSSIKNHATLFGSSQVVSSNQIKQNQAPQNPTILWYILWSSCYCIYFGLHILIHNCFGGRHAVKSSSYQKPFFFSSISWSISYKATSLFFCIEYPTSLILHSLRNIKFFSLKKKK